MKKYRLINKFNDISLLVNKDYHLPLTYTPDNLEKINDLYSENIQYLKHEARINFEKMAKDIEKLNMKIIAVSTYRDSSYQDKLFKKYVKDKGLEYAKMCSAQAGASEHQTGLAVDIANNSLDYDNFDKTKEFNWVSKNCYKYGFILRYPKDKTNITKYKYEPWHYRYVGDIAEYIYKNNLTLEEYKKLIES